MKSPDLFPGIAQALAVDVESASSDSKRLKLRTLLAKFGYEKRSDSNTAEITRVLSEAVSLQGAGQEKVAPSH